MRMRSITEWLLYSMPYPSLGHGADDDLFGLFSSPMPQQDVELLGHVDGALSAVPIPQAAPAMVR